MPVINNTIIKSEVQETITYTTNNTFTTNQTSSQNSTTSNKTVIPTVTTSITTVTSELYKPVNVSSSISETKISTTTVEVHRPKVI